MNMNKLIIKKIGYDFQKENIDYLSSLSGRERLKVLYVLPNYSLLENTRLDLLNKIEGIHTQNILTFDDLANKYSKTSKSLISRNEGSWIVKKIVEKFEDIKFSTSLGTSKEILSYILFMKSNGIDSKRFLKESEGYIELKKIGEIYNQYEDFLEKNNLEDEIGRYASATENIINSKHLDKTEIIISGFIEFRTHELKMIGALSQKNVKIIVQYPFKIKRENLKVKKMESDLLSLGFEVIIDNQINEDLAYDIFSNSKAIKDVPVIEIAASNMYYEMREIFINIKKNLHRVELDEVSIVVSEEYEELIKRLSIETNIPISIMNEEKGKELPLVGSFINFLEFILKEEKKKLISYLHDDNLNTDFQQNKDELIRSLLEIQYKGIFHKYDEEEELRDFFRSIRELVERIKNNPSIELINYLNEKNFKENIIESYGIHKDINILKNSLNSLDLIMDSLEEVKTFSRILPLKGEDFLEILIEILKNSKYYSKDDTIGVQVLRPINSIGTRSKLRFICGLGSDYPNINQRSYFFSIKFRKFYENLRINIEEIQEIFDNAILLFSQSIAGSKELVFSYTYTDSTLSDDKSYFLKDIKKRVKEESYKDIRIKSMVKPNVDLFDNTRDRALSNIYKNKSIGEIELNYFSNKEIERLQNNLSDNYKRLKGDDKFWGAIDDKFIFNEYYATKLDTFNTCPFKFYLKEILDYKPLSLEYIDEYSIDKGNLYHEILNVLYKNIDVFNIELEIIKEEINKLVDIYLIEKEDDVEIEIQKNIYKDILLGFVKADILEHKKIKSKFNPKYFEKEFGKNFGNFNVRGKIDRIDEDNNGNLIVIDYKSKSTPSGEKVRNLENIQLPIYSYILDKERVKAAYYASIQGASLTKGFYHREFAPPNTKKTFTEEEIQNFYEKVKELILEINNSINNGEFFVRPKTKDSCKFCDYKDICRIEEVPANGV